MNPEIALVNVAVVKLLIVVLIAYRYAREGRGDYKWLPRNRILREIAKFFLRRRTGCPLILCGGLLAALILKNQFQYF